MADNFTLIGKVVSNTTAMTTPKEGEGRPKAEVGIQPVTGKAVKWGTFHVSLAKDLELNRWYSFEVSTPTRQGGSGVWNNLEGVNGPVDEPQPGTPAGAAAQAASGPAHTVKSDAQYGRERTSLQRQGAMGIVVRLIEAGVKADKLGETIDLVLQHAETVEAFYNRGFEDQLAPTRRSPSRKAEQTELPDPSVNGAMSDDDTAKDAEVESLGAPRFGNAGDLMMKVTGEFKGKTSGDVCKLLGVAKPTDIEDLDAAYLKAREAWGTPA